MSATDQYDRADAPADALRLHLNEHTGGCSPAVLAAVRSVDATTIAKYQDYGPLHDAAARFFGLPASRILLTNGLDEGLFAAAMAWLRADQSEAVILEPAFGMYADCVSAVGGTIQRVMPRADFSLDIDAVANAVSAATGLLFVTSPGNPTGLPLTSGDVRRLAAVLPDDALLFLDEAYAEFAAETFLPRLDECPNVVIGRTFAKAYGLAGLRAGAVLGSDEAIARLRRVVPPYSLNVFVVAALPAALDDRAYVDDYVEQVRESRALMYDACARLGLSHVPSAANFVLVRAGDRREALLAGLEARNIYVRDRHTQPGCAGCIRITTGIVEHTRLCIEAMEDILCARE